MMHPPSPLPTPLSSIPQDREVAQSPTPMTPKNAQPPLRLVRDYSALSKRAISRISEIGDGLSAYEKQIEDIEKGLASSSIAIGKAKADLGQLHGNVFKLLSNQVDAVQTGELNSGKDVARAERKDLSHRAEALLDRVEGRRSGL